MINIVSSIITVSVFGILGYLFSRKSLKKVSYLKLFIWLIISILFINIGKETKIISILNFNILLNQIIGSFAIGYTIFIVKKLFNNNKLNVIQ